LYKSTLVLKMDNSSCSSTNTKSHIEKAHFR
jgi:hypothetical protein